MVAEVAARPGYKEAIDLVAIDHCCNGHTCNASSLDSHPTKLAFDTRNAAKGDQCRKITSILEQTRRQSLYHAEHISELNSIFFNDILDTGELNRQSPMWMELWNYVKLDAALKDTVPAALADSDLYIHTRIAMMQRFRRENEDSFTSGETLEQKSAPNLSTDSFTRYPAHNHRRKLNYISVSGNCNTDTDPNSHSDLTSYV